MWLYNTYMFLLLFRSKIFAGKDIDKKKRPGRKRREGIHAYSKEGKRCGGVHGHEKRKTKYIFPKGVVKINLSAWIRRWMLTAKYKNGIFYFREYGNKSENMKLVSRI